MKSAPAIRKAVAWAMAFLFVLISTSSCKKKGPIPFDAAFAQYISAFTSGSISAASNIRIRLTDAFVSEIKLDEPISENLLEFSPSLEGQLFWIDNQTLEFRPAQWLPRGEVYEGTLNLDKIVNVPANLKKFKFSFLAMSQHMSVQVNSIKPYQNDQLQWMQLNGTVTTLDVCDNAAMPKTIKAQENSRELNVNWSHDNDPHIHRFTVDSIARTEADEKVIMKWDGSAIESEFKQENSQEIPALGNFKVFFHQIVQEPDQYVQLQFSDPLLPNQELEGLVTMPAVSGLRFTIEGNEIRVYSPYRLTGDMQLYVHAGIKNIAGFANKEEQMLELKFEELKPEVEIEDPERVILPSTDGLVFPFKAVNLSAVNVRVIRIYENNVPQFLQVNDLSGTDEMRRVGRVVKRKTVQLNDGKKNLAQWNTFFLNLSEIINAEPGAIYRVEIGFQKSYALCHCEDSGDVNETQMTSSEEARKFEQEDDMSWDQDNGWGDYYSEYYDYYDEDYDYSERENPCNSAYYTYREPTAKNILASDIGIIGKRGNDNSVHFAVTDIKTTKPMSEVNLEVLNYQQQVIAKLKTDGQGFAKIDNVNGVPFLLVAKQGKQRGYLKLDNPHALSLSNFDISGEESQKGLKGFLYGERGVWRPGDSLYLTFILEDEKKVLPEIHPVNFELKNTKGQVVQKAVRSKNESGFFSFPCVTSPDAETGTYQAIVKVGGATFSKSIRIETIKPNRLKLNMDFGGDMVTALGQDVNCTLEAKWLHGATAKNLKANVSATFTEASTSFANFKDFEFSDPVRSFTSEEQVIFDNYLSAEGKANISMKANMSDRAPGMLNANFSVKVFEEGGDFSTDRFTVNYAPYVNFVGIDVPETKNSYALETDKSYVINVATVNAQGKPVALPQLKWKAYKVEWRWWWERNNDDLANYVGSESTTAVYEGELQTNGDGRGAISLSVPKMQWGRYLIRIEDPQGGHATGQTVYFDWPSEEGRASRENPDGANVLSFTMDKEKYLTGESCKITFPSSAGGRALVSIENSNGVIEASWVETKKGETSYSFKTNEKMTPNAYINVSLLQPHNQTANDLPIRLYGVMPLFVEFPGSHLYPQISMADELGPEKEFEVKVTEKTGKAMTYTLAIVDDGLLDLTRFKTPDPWNYFYAREALGVSTFDLYDQVIGAFGSRLEKAISIGGSDDGGGKGKNRANRFKPVVIYVGPFTLESGKSKTHKLQMPNYIGSVRVMVIAGKDMAYGNAEKTVPVKKPLMVLASLPRVLGPGEEVKLPVTVFAMDKNIQNVNVTVEANNMFTMLEGTNKSLAFAEPGDDVINFPMRVNDKVGIGKVLVTVTSGSLKSTYEVEMDIRNPNPVITNVVEGIVEKGQTWTGNFDLAGMDGTNTATLEVYSIPPVDFGRRLKFLLDYPHGCVEQTTSAVFPQLYLSDVMDLGEQEKAKAVENIKAGINRLAKFQLRSGGMTYWPGYGTEDEWGSCYSGHFMLEAKKKGYTLPPNWESAWIGYQQKMAQNWLMQDARSGNYYWRENDIIQSYRLYTLALAGKPEMGAMNRMKERSDISVAARWRLAAAYALAGRIEDAKALTNNRPMVVSPYTSLSYSYGSNWRDNAMIIEALVLMNRRIEAAPLIKDLAKELSSYTWYSTQTVAYSLIAYASFAQGEVGQTISYTTTHNGKSGPNKSTNKPMSTEKLAVGQVSGNKVEVKNNGNNLLYVRVVLSGQPANGQETPANNNLYVEVAYTDIKGNAIDVSRLEQGTDFIAQVTLWNPGTRGRLDELALTQIFPSGWEIINNRFDPSAVVMAVDQPEYQDIRDDRIFSYLDLGQNETKRFRVKLNATYLGKYYLPAVNCEAMYDATINARNAGKWVEVVMPGGSIVQK
jgi:alpha-2-macroglobulin